MRGSVVFALTPPLKTRGQSLEVGTEELDPTFCEAGSEPCMRRQ